MARQLKTIEVENPDGEGTMTINEIDFDPTIHKKPSAPKRERKEKEPEPKTEAEKKTRKARRPLDRADQLEKLYQQEGWQAIQKIAEPLNIEKPKGGWRLAIPLIIDEENKPNGGESELSAAVSEPA